MHPCTKRAIASKRPYWHAHWHYYWHSRPQLACLLALSLRNGLRSRGWGAVDPPAFARQSRITGTLVSVNRASLAACDSQSALHWHSRARWIQHDPPSSTPIRACRFLLTPNLSCCPRALARVTPIRRRVERRLPHGPVQARADPAFPYSLSLSGRSTVHLETGDPPPTQALAHRGVPRSSGGTGATYTPTRQTVFRTILPTRAY